MEQHTPLTVSITLNAPIEKVWEFWTKPEHITQWNSASDDWECPSAANDLRPGGKYAARMQAKDGSSGFDFEATYTAVKERELLEYDMADGRHVKVAFAEIPEGVVVTETFDPENENPLEMQRGGWQAILDNFKKYVHTQSWMMNLESEGYEDIRVCPLPPNQDLPEHTHDEYTVHIILHGDLTIADATGAKTYKPGDRVEFMPGTTHRARGSIDNGTMIIGVKKR